MADTRFPALPPAGGMSRFSGSSSMTPAQRARIMFGGLGNRAGVSVRRAGGGAALALRKQSETDTLGNIFAQGIPTAGAAASMGFVDQTSLSKKLEEATGGWLKGSTAIALAGGVARGLNLDSKVPYVGKPLARANTALLRSMVPIWSYQAGARLHGALAKRMSGGAPQLSGVGIPPEVGGVAEKKAEIEPIPGEETTA